MIENEIERQPYMMMSFTGVNNVITSHVIDGVTSLTIYQGSSAGVLYVVLDDEGWKKVISQVTDRLNEKNDTITGKVKP